MNFLSFYLRKFLFLLHLFKLVVIIIFFSTLNISFYSHSLGDFDKQVIVIFIVPLQVR